MSILTVELTDELRRVLVRALQDHAELIEDFVDEGCSWEEADAAEVELDAVDHLIEMIDDESLWEEKPHLTLIQGGKS